MNRIPPAFIQSFRMLRRDLRAGELGLLLIALIIAVASLTSVGFFTDRVARALKLEANQLLGGDIVMVAIGASDRVSMEQLEQDAGAVVESFRELKKKTEPNVKKWWQFFK